MSDPLDSVDIAEALDAASDGLPGTRPRKPVGHPRTFPSAEAAFRALTVEEHGGHLRWVGRTSGVAGTPVLAHASKVQTAFRFAFRQHHGRDPVGNVRPVCAFRGCVAGAHLVDRQMREGGAT